MNLLPLRLKKLRHEKNVLQKDIANVLNISTSAYGFYEQGKRIPDANTLNLLAEYFSVSVDYLLGRTNERDINSSLSKSPSTKKEETDIAVSLEEMKRKLATSDSLMFDGQPATEEQIQAILNAIEMGEAYAKQRAKEKFTPKKYRK